MEIGEDYLIPPSYRHGPEEVRRAVYLNGQRVGSLLRAKVDDDTVGWRADHDRHGQIGDWNWRNKQSAEAAALLVAQVDSEPLLSFPGNPTDADRGRAFAGIWAKPLPAGVRNVFLDRALEANRHRLRHMSPWDYERWIDTVSNLEPFAQYDENVRRTLEEAPPEARQFLTALTADLRSSLDEVGAKLRADLRPMLMEHIATRNGRKKAVELWNEMLQERLERVREVVRERIDLARSGAGENGLSADQAENYLASVLGGAGDPDQVSYGVRGDYPEAFRPVVAALSDARAYRTAFSGWATQDDSGRWSGQYWENGRRRQLGAPTEPSANPETGEGELIIGEAPLPKGMRWVKGADLRAGDIYHPMTLRNDDSGVFDGANPPELVVNTHRDGVEGAIRSVSLDAERGADSTQPDSWVILVEKPEANVRKRASHRKRTDIFLNWNIPTDDEEYELGGPDRVMELRARAELTELKSEKRGRGSVWSVSVDGVEIGQIKNGFDDQVLEHHAEGPDGYRRTWHRHDLAVAGLVAHHESRADADGEQDREQETDREQDREQETDREQDREQETDRE
ncbi:hypothetical protein ACIQ9R_35835, partial [Streptomyces sp. NPDC094447]|uniref:hypothetical protein n=1 Tax=Streptomyces sp. NPDC094447 TaxID=3366062 RepID=UPI0037F86ED1